MMKKLINLFRLRREERWPALMAMVYALTLNSLVIARFYEVFTNVVDNVWKPFLNSFIVSGFDPLTYLIVTSWDARYNVYRHPLLAFMDWPLYALNWLLTGLTGLNCAQFIVAVPLVFCAFYSFIFLMRTLRDVVGAPRFEAVLLSMLFLSFAYVMVTVSVPDHFCISMFLLLFSIYVAGMKLKRGGRFTIGQTVLLFLITAGVTLSNGCKTFLYALFTNGRRFFRPKYLLLAVVLPSLAIWVFARWEYRTFAWPKEQARKATKIRKSNEKRKQAFIAFMDTTAIKDTSMATKAFNEMMQKRVIARYKADRKKPWNQHTGKPMGKGEFMRWTDVSTSRWQTAVENLFGESIQLHPDHLLMDTLRSRPVIVPYRWAFSYVVEGLLFALFLLGIWCGRRSRFLWMVLSGFAFDMALHMGLGFGINEVYIMAGHWLFALPVAMGFIATHRLAPKLRLSFRVLLSALALYLFIYNFALYAFYLL